MFIDWYLAFRWGTRSKWDTLYTVCKGEDVDLHLPFMSPPCISKQDLLGFLLYACCQIPVLGNLF